MWMKRVFAVLTACAVLGSCPVPAFGTGDSDAAHMGLSLGVSVVCTEEELADWLWEHEESGGKVALGTSIAITNTLHVFAAAPTTIDTGRFGIVLEGGYLIDWDGNLSIAGEGVDMPVMELQEPGWIWMDNWNTILQWLQITATGRDGTGGTALRISAVDDTFADTDRLEDRGHIRSYGRGAVGIEFAAPAEAMASPIEAMGFRVSVEGEDSVAVRTDESVRLWFCDLEATGQGAVAASGTDLVLNNCNTTPEPIGVTSIRRQIADISGQRFYLPVKQGNAGYVNDLRDFYTYFNFILSGNDQLSPMTMPMTVVWEDAAYQLDCNALGETVVSGTLNPALQGYGLEGEFPLEMIIDVRDPAKPCISEVDFHEGYVILTPWKSYDSRNGGVLLWYSDDGGENWRDITLADNVDWSQFDITYHFGALDAPVQLFIEEPGVGESNVVTLYQKDGETLGGPGGDRTGTDRDGAGTGTPQPPGGEDKTPPDDSGDGAEPGKDGPLPPDDGNAGEGEPPSDGGTGMAPGTGDLPGSTGQSPRSGGRSEADTDSGSREVTAIREQYEAPVENNVSTLTAAPDFPEAQPVVSATNWEATDIVGADDTDAHPVIAGTSAEYSMEAEAVVAALPAKPESPLPGDPFDTGIALGLFAAVAALLGAVLLLRRVRGKRR